MTDAKASGWTSKRGAVVAGVVPATIGASVLYASVFHEWDAWFALQAAIAGGLLGHLVWVCLDVRHRVTRAGAILVSFCLAAWAIFLLFGAPREWPQPAQRSDAAVLRRGRHGRGPVLRVVAGGRERMVGVPPPSPGAARRGPGHDGVTGTTALAFRPGLRTPG